MEVSVKLLQDGFTVLLGDKSYPVNYPTHVWSAMPETFRLPYAELMAYVSTVHDTFNGKEHIIYNFPPPRGESIFNYGHLLSASENLIDYPGVKSTDYIRPIYNSFFRYKFIKLHKSDHTRATYHPKKNTVFLPFSFGKDSLLTYALCKKMQLEVVPIFMVEPGNINENLSKFKLIKQFEKDFGQKILTFKVPLTKLRQNSGKSWGWDLLLTRYTLWMIPFLYYYKPRYFFWSNEYTANETVTDDEGFCVNAVFDQSSRWLQVLESLLGIYGCPVRLGSIIEPLSKLPILYILHRNFPEYAKYQTSCDFLGKKGMRWCGKCEECATNFLFLKALGFNPESVSLTEDMLNRKKRKLFYYFDLNKNYIFTKFLWRYLERSYAFYLLEKKGCVEDLVQEFSKKQLRQFPDIKKDAEKLIFTVHDSTTISDEILVNLLPIFSRGLLQMKQELNKTT